MEILKPILKAVILLERSIRVFLLHFTVTIINCTQYVNQSMVSWRSAGYVLYKVLVKRYENNNARTREVQHMKATCLLSRIGQSVDINLPQPVESVVGSHNRVKIDSTYYNHVSIYFLSNGPSSQKTSFNNHGLPRDLPIKTTVKIQAIQQSEFIVSMIIRSSVPYSNGRSSSLIYPYKLIALPLSVSISAELKLIICQWRLTDDNEIMETSTVKQRNITSFRSGVYSIPYQHTSLFYARLQYLFQCHKSRASSDGSGRNNIYFHFLNFRVVLFAQVPFKECHQLRGPVSNGLVWWGS